MKRGATLRMYKDHRRQGNEPCSLHTCPNHSSLRLPFLFLLQAVTWMMVCGIQWASTPEGTASLSLWIMMQHPRLRTPPGCRFILEIAITLEVNSPAFEVENKGGRMQWTVISLWQFFLCQTDHSPSTHARTPALRPKEMRSKLSHSCTNINYLGRCWGKKKKT